MALYRTVRADFAPSMLSILDASPQPRETLMACMRVCVLFIYISFYIYIYIHISPCWYIRASFIYITRPIDVGYVLYAIYVLSYGRVRPPVHTLRYFIFLEVI